MVGAAGEKRKSHAGRNVAIIALASAVVLIVWFAWKRMAPYHSGLAASQEQTAANQPQIGPPSADDREQRMANMMSQLRLTPEQEKQIEALGLPEPGSGSGGQRREQLAKILTPEQLEVFDSVRSKRMRQKLKESKPYLNPQDYQKLKERMEQRKEQGGEFRGAGGGGGGQR